MRFSLHHPVPVRNMAAMDDAERTRYSSSAAANREGFQQQIPPARRTLTQGRR
jgi:hypothetical protein